MLSVRSGRDRGRREHDVDAPRPAGRMPARATARDRAEQTRLGVVVRGSKRGRTRTVPWHAEAHDALRRWYASCPSSSSDALFIGKRRRRSARPDPLSPSAVGDIAVEHASSRSWCGPPPHALRHTLSTMLANRGDRDRFPGASRRQARRIDLARDVGPTRARARRPLRLTTDMNPSKRGAIRSGRDACGGSTPARAYGTSPPSTHQTRAQHHQPTPLLRSSSPREVNFRPALRGQSSTGLDSQQGLT